MFHVVPGLKSRGEHQVEKIVGQPLSLYIGLVQSQNLLLPLNRYRLLTLEAI